MLARTPDAKLFRVGRIRIRVPQDENALYQTDGSDRPMKIHERALIVAAGSIPSLARGITGEYDGESIVVRDVLPTENGDVLRVVIVAAS